MPVNPFVELYRAPVATLSAIAYALLLLALSIWNAGAIYRAAVRLNTEVEKRHIDANQWAPAWQYVPPWRVILLASGTVFALAVEFALLAGMVYIL